MSKLFNLITKLSIYALVFFTPLFFLPFSLEAYEFNKQYLVFFLVSLGTLSWLAKMVLIDKELRFKRSPLDAPILIFLSIAVLGAIFSVDRISSIFGFYGRFSDGLIGLISMVMMYFLIINNVGIEKGQKSEDEERDGHLLSVRGTLKAFLWSILFVIIFSYLSVFNVLGTMKWLPEIMQRNIFNPVAGSLEGLAVFLAVVAIFLTGMIMADSKLKSSKIQKIIVPVLLVLSLFMLLIIDFNRAWILIFTTLLVCVAICLAKRIFKEDVNKLLLPIFLMIISATVLLVDTSSLQSMVLKSGLNQEQILSQKYSFSVAFKAATENVKSMLVGSGTGTFFHDFAKFKSQDFNQTMLWYIRLDRPSNHFAEILATMGFLGILSYMLLISVFLMAGYLLIRQSREALPLIMIFLALLVGQFVFYQNTVLAFCFWLFAALSAVTWQKPAKEKSISFRSFPELSLVVSVLLMVLAAGVFAIYFLGAKFYLADVNYAQALKEGSMEKLIRAVNLNSYQSIYKTDLSRRYLDILSVEMRKPKDQVNENVLALYASQAINYSKGGDMAEGDKIIRIKGATELSPNNVVSWENLAVVYRELYNVVGADAFGWSVKSFEKAISLEPNNPVLHNELGKIYLNYLNDAPKAKEEFLRTKELKPDYIDALINEALVLSQEGSDQEAIAKLESLLKDYPGATSNEIADITFALGRLYYDNNQNSKAITQLLEAIRLVPNHSNAHFYLGAAYRASGEISKAITEFERVLELNPGHAETQEILKKLKSSIGQ